MSEVLRAAIGNGELLDNYGDSVLDDGLSISSHWTAACDTYTKAGNYDTAGAPVFSNLRQQLLRIHLDCVPDDKRWQR